MYIPGPTWGFEVDPLTRDLLIDASNTVEGQSAFVADGIDGLVVEGLILLGRRRAAAPEPA